MIPRSAGNLEDGFHKILIHPRRRGGVLNTCQRPFDIPRRSNIYVQIARVYFYKIAKGADASLVLLIVDFPGLQAGSSMIGSKFINQLPDRFRPAVLSGLLKIEWVSYSDDQVRAMKSINGN